MTATITLYKVEMNWTHRKNQHKIPVEGVWLTSEIVNSAVINSPRNPEILIGLIAFDNVWGYDNIYAQIDGYNLHEQIHSTI